MVQSRGIKINVISQLDAQRLPEHSTAQISDTLGRVVACYIPIYAGAQSWLEYSIDGPNPPGAAYFFKMFVNDRVVSSWDCTSNHDYHGKAVFCLYTVETNRKGEKLILQKSLAFTSLNGEWSPKSKDDCIEVRVYRIEHRRRVRDLPLDTPPPKELGNPSTIRMIDHGPIELCRPARRYQYQLLDPRDEPYAAFRFYCRTQEYLERHRLLDVRHSLSPSSLAISASNYFDTRSSPTKRDSQLVEDIHSPTHPTHAITHETGRDQSPNTLKGLAISPRHIYSPQKEEISSVIRDSIEDLPSSVPRSPQSPKRLRCQRNDEEDVPPSPTKPSSSLFPEALHIRKTPGSQASTDHATHQSKHQSHKGSLRPVHNRISTGSPTRPSHRRHKPSNLKLTLDGSPFSLSRHLSRSTEDKHEPKPSRPLSPFTPGGFLRRLTSNPDITPPERPNRIPTQITPSISASQDEIDQAMNQSHLSQKRQLSSESLESSAGTMTTRLHRGGGFLIDFLGRRVEKRTAIRYDGM